MILSVGLDLGSWIVQGQRPVKQGAVHGWDLGIVDRTREYMRMGDSDYLSQRGYATAQFAKGVREPVVVYRTQMEYAWTGYTYVIGAFYALFDFSPVAVKGINCLLGALLGSCIFFLAKACIDVGSARWACILVTFFPSLVLWSATNLKEPSLVLLTALLLWLFVKIRQAQGLKAVAFYGSLFACALFAHMTLRSPIYSLSLVGCLLIATGLRWIRKGWQVLLLVGGLVGLVWVRSADVQGILASAFLKHIGHFWTPGVSYRYLPDELYMPEYFRQWVSSGTMGLAFALKAITQATFHYLVEPLPSRMDNLFSLVVYPQMMFWYFSLPLGFLGIAWSLRRNFHRSFFLVLVVWVWLVIGGLTGGNVGTAFRVRDMITPFFLIFACAGARGLAFGPTALGAVSRRDPP